MVGEKHEGVFAPPPPSKIGLMYYGAQSEQVIILKLL